MKKEEAERRGIVESTVEGQPYKSVGEQERIPWEPPVFRQLDASEAGKIGPGPDAGNMASG